MYTVGKKEDSIMKKNQKIITLLATIVLCFMIATPVHAATKYSKTEKSLAYALACFQDNELIDPDSFEIRHINKVKYSLKKSCYDLYEAFGLLDYCKTISWEVEYSASNYLGGTITDTVYISSTYNYFTEDDLDFEEYTDKTDYKNRKKSKSFVSKIKKLTKKYYNEF